jgi:fucose permease
MASRLLLIVIYLSFISLGLPDSLLGPAWPTMYKSFSVPVQYAGIISMIVAGGTVISSLFSARLIRRIGVASVTMCSVLLTALALLGFSYSNHFIFLCLLAIPLGLGAGCVDAALNNYVALHYEARHMNWLHCFWGVGAAIGPMIMSAYLSAGKSWSLGYKTVGLIQAGLAIILLFSASLWIGNKTSSNTVEKNHEPVSFPELLKLPGFKQVLLVFFCYCTIEATFGLWGASFLVFTRDYSPEAAARLVSFFYIGITLGRFLSGFITLRLSNQQLVYAGQSVLAAGLIILILPFQSSTLAAFFLVGLGCAPVFPALLHETPENFGIKYSQAIMGIQMASAYIGITLMPFLFGQLASFAGYSSFIWFIGVVLVIKIFANRVLNAKVANKKN